MTDALVNVCGAERPFALHLRKPRSPGGRLRSCPPGWAAPSPPPLLRSAGHPPPLAATDGGVQAVPRRRSVRSGRWGVLRSEVKEERRAKPGAGDMSGAARPGGPISHLCLHARLAGRTAAPPSKAVRHEDPEGIETQRGPSPPEPLR